MNEWKWPDKMKRLLTSAVVGVLLSAAGCSQFHLGPDPMSPKGQNRWVEKSIESMSLRNQAASLIVVAVTAGYSHVDSPDRLRTESLVRDLCVGGIAMWGGDPYDEALVIARLQEIAHLPLLVATDNEWGLGMRIGGSSIFPKAMALGATRDTALARQTGYITGMETRAVGIHMGYSPVADVNINPLNPIISVRSFGEDPDLVAAMAGAWARGAQDAGMLATAKHYPGHGDVSVDSHMELPVVDVGMERLEQVELAPFRALVKQGIDAIMVAHLWIPAFDPDEVVPSSLSANVVQGYLRDQLGFEGLIVTDALRMGAIVRNFGVEEAAVRAVEAGVDLIVLPGDARRSIDGLMEAVESGRLDAGKITTAARRLLRFKARLGLHVRRQVPLRGVEETVGDPRIKILARTITERSITVVKNENGILPLGTGSETAPPPEDEYAAAAPPKVSGPFKSRFTVSEEKWTDSPEDSVRVVFLGLSSDPGNGPVGSSFFSPLRQLFPDAARFDLYPEYSPQQAEEVLSAVESAHLVVTAVISRVRDQKGHAAVVEPHATLLNYITARGIPVVVAAFGPPYFLSQFPDVDAYLAAYDYSAMAQRVAGEVVLGATGARGRLPVSLPDLYPIGWGINVGPSVER